MMRSAHDGQILLWPALIGRLRFLMDVDEAQFAGHLGVDEPTVEGWERGLLVPERRTQKILRDRLHRLEPAISLKAIEAMPVISAIHCNTSLALCCAASALVSASRNSANRISVLARSSRRETFVAARGR